MPTMTDVQRAAAGSLLATFLLQGSLVVSGVAAARLLGPELRGYLALLVLLPSVLARIGGLGIPLALPFFVARDPASAGAVARMILPTAVLQTAVLVGLQAVALTRFTLGRPHEIQIAAILTLFAVPTLLTLDYTIGLLQGQQRFGAFNVLRGLPACLYALGVFALLILRAGSLFNVTLVLTLSGLVVAPISLFVCLRGLPSIRRPRYVPSRSEVVRFGLRGLLGSVSPIETFRLDQAIVGLLLSPAALGLYVVALAFTNLPRFVSQSLGFVAYPHIAAKAEGPREWAALRTFFVWSMILTIPVVVALAAAADFLVPLFFGNGFQAAIPIVRILLIGSLFLAARRLLTDGSRGFGYPGAGTVAEVASWIWLIPSVLLLAGPFGLQGIAASFAGASAFSLVVLIFILLIKRSSPVERQEWPSASDVPAAILQ